MTDGDGNVVADTETDENDNTLYKSLGKAGMIITCVGLLQTVIRAQELYEDTGDLHEPIKMITEWTLQFLSGLAGAGIAVSAVAPLAASLCTIPVIGPVAAVVVEICAAGGMLVGENIGEIINDISWQIGDFIL